MKPAQDIDVTEDYLAIGAKRMSDVLPWELAAWKLLQCAVRVGDRYVIQGSKHTSSSPLAKGKGLSV